MSGRNASPQLRRGTLARRTAIATTASALLLVLAACGSSSSATSTGGTATTGATAAAGSSTAAGSTASGSAGVGAAQTALQADYAGTDTALPTSTPKIPAGKSVYVISCAQAAEGCSVPADAAVTAGQKLGWKMTVFDGQLTPSVYVQGINQAIASHASAIILVSVDCDFAAAPLQAARKAGIVIYSVYSLDCNETGSGASVLSGNLPLSGQDTFSKSVAVTGVAVGDWIVATSNGKANVLEMRANFDQGPQDFELAAEKELHQTCPACPLSVVPFSAASLTNNGLVQSVSSALTAHPKTTAIIAPFDSSVLLGIGQAVKQSGRSIAVAGDEGLAPNIAEIRAGGPQSMAAGAPSQRVGWAAIDELIRLFDGQPSVSEGLGHQTIDHTHNLPTSPAYYDGNVGADGKPKVDYQAAYAKLWGLGAGK